MGQYALAAGNALEGSPDGKRRRNPRGPEIVSDRRRGSSPVRGRRYFVSLVSGLVLITAYLALVQRVQLVRLVPGLAIVFKTMGLPVNIYYAEFENVRASLNNGGGETQLIVEGQIKNLRSSVNPLRDVQFSLAGKDGTVVYSWVAKLPQKSLKPGESLNFRTSLAGPPAGNHTVELVFVR